MHASQLRRLKQIDFGASLVVTLLNRTVQILVTPVLTKTLRAPKTPRACQNHEEQLETAAEIQHFPEIKF
jgi:hypothetical protein